MSGWTVNEDAPDKLEKYGWHSENDSDQVMSETQNIRDLRIKPADIDFVPRDLQVPAERLWEIDDDPSSTGWYVLGEVVDG